MNKKSVLKELANLLREAEDQKPKGLLQDDSVDLQIDKFFIDYEKQSTGSKNESYYLRSLTRMLLEDGEQPDQPEGEKQIDPSVFASSVMRLISNHDSLLDVTNVIAKRAFNFILKNYDVSTAKEFIDIMRRDYDFEIDKTEYDKETEDEEPFASRAGGTSGAGG